MNVLMSGSTGLVGSALIARLKAHGHRVSRLVRPTTRCAEPSILWDPSAQSLDERSLATFDAVIHLAGENIASRRWTEAQKQRIRKSRIDGTSLLAIALARLEPPPAVLISASAIGYYGARGDEVLDEDSAAGNGFLAAVCRDWESAAEPAAARGIRVVAMRTGIVLSRSGGALKKMLLPFQLGLGGRIGSGTQYMSWITLDDVAAAYLHVLEDRSGSLRGPVNIVAPDAVTNLEFTRTLGKVLGRPTWLPLPAFAARLALGEMADELLLTSNRVVPRRLQASGFPFAHPHLEAALRHVLAR